MSSFSDITLYITDELIFWWKFKTKNIHMTFLSSPLKKFGQCHFVSEISSKRHAYQLISFLTTGAISKQFDQHPVRKLGIGSTKYGNKHCAFIFFYIKIKCLRRLFKNRRMPCHFLCLFQLDAARLSTYAG